ncbi:hypothetical protein ACQKQD_01715 [Methylobacterium sp. NPDC080182]|uniref:hypothetical protein n=1 Tax=Methylobacterium sp. NPDC080182 TaxID=3390590 RepID=UPI003D02A7BD
MSMAFNQILFSIFVYLVTTICGTVVGGILGFLVGAWYIDIMKVTQREGTAGYMVVLLFTLIGASLGAVSALVALVIRRHYY